MVNLISGSECAESIKSEDLIISSSIITLSLDFGESPNNHLEVGSESIKKILVAHTPE